MGFVNTPMVHSGGTPHLHEPMLHERRFIYGYGLDGSDFPCYLMWPERVGSEQSVALLDSQANWWCKLTEVGYMCPLDLHHLMDAFRITAELSSAHLREIAVQQLPEGEVTADCQVSMDAARRKGWLVHEEQPVDLVAPEADVRNVPEDVISFFFFFFFSLLFPKQCEGSHQVGANCTGLEALGKPARGCKETETGELENKAEKTA